MGTLLKALKPADTDYVDRRYKGTKEQYFTLLNSSTTLYIGNLSFYTTEDQVYELFSLVGRVKRIHMGLDKMKRTPCGFCFVIYYKRTDALNAIKYLNGTLLDGRPIRVDVDYGYEEDRKWGRGRSGGQVRDEYRLDYDEGRGGFGVQIWQAHYGSSSFAAVPHAPPVWFGAGQRPQAPNGKTAAAGEPAAEGGTAEDAAAAVEGEANGQAAADGGEGDAGAASGRDAPELLGHDTPAPKRRRMAAAADAADEPAEEQQPPEEQQQQEQQQQAGEEDAAMADAGGGADAAQQDDIVDYE